MRRNHILLCLVLLIVIALACKKKKGIDDNNDLILAANTIVVSNDAINNSLIAVDSNTLVFNANGDGVDKINVGSILVSDMSSVAPDGFLRIVTAISATGGQKICSTEQASLADAIIQGNVTFTHHFSDDDILEEDTSGVDITAQKTSSGLSFRIPYTNKIDNNVSISGEFKVELSMSFELDIDGSKVNKFLTTITLINTNEISAEVKTSSGIISKEIILKTFKLKPFTILVGGVLPIPIARQWIVIALGVDGKVSAKITMGAVNKNTITGGIVYENGGWNTTYNRENSFSFSQPTFSAEAKIEPWIQARYEIRPYGIKSSRIYVAARASVIGEAVAMVPDTCLIKTKLDWGIRLSAKAQMQLFGKGIIDYDLTFLDETYPIYSKDSITPIKVETTDVTQIMKKTAKSGGKITYLTDCKPAIIARGVCWDTLANPTLENDRTIDGLGNGSFSSSITGLTPGTEYHLRAYAVTDYDTVYGDEKMFTTKLCEIGDTAFGGIVFYIDGSGKHGMVCALTDQATVDINLNGGLKWGWQTAPPYPVVGTDTSLGSGFLNTNTIINVLGAGNYAAKACKDYNGGGYNDWFLPSLAELRMLYNNRQLVKGFGEWGCCMCIVPDYTVGCSTFYLSSSEGLWDPNEGVCGFGYSDNVPWNGDGGFTKYWDANVRAVRNF